jgi:hypothetical protein
MMARPRKKPPVAQRSAFQATAERIAEWLQTKEQLIDMIETALLAERERCAKIAETMRPSGGRMWTDEQSACFEALTACAITIREGKPQE